MRLVSEFPCELRPAASSVGVGKIPNPVHEIQAFFGFQPLEGSFG
jgi:hypothetical protein